MPRARIGWFVVPLLSLALCAAGAAQEPPPGEPVTARDPQPGDETRVFVLEHTIPRVMAEVLEVFPATITYSSYGPQPQQAIAVSAPPAVMAAIEQTIERLDRPPAPVREIEITGYIVEALSEPADTEVPAVLEPVIVQLRETFRYQGYRVLDSVIARASEGSGLRIGGAGQSSAFDSVSYDLNAKRLTVVSTVDGGVRVRADELYLGVAARHDPQPGSPPSQVNPKVQASIEIGEGQQVVVGKAGLGESGNALIFVLSARVVD